MDNLDQVIDIFSQDNDIKLVYLFGSQATGDTGPLSDYDFAIYLDEKDSNSNSKRIFDKKNEVQAKIARALSTDKVDIVAIDSIKEPEFAYNIIAYGKLIFEREPYKVIVEPKILNEYFDFRDAMRRFNLTKA